jgi:LysM repeat protein
MKRTFVMCWMVALAGLTACSSATLQAPTATPTLRSGTLVPYQSSTPTLTTATILPPDPSTSTPLPTATPTPRTHVVKAGEDMGGIAYRYRVKLADLKAANPSVNPNLMKIGTVLIIPGYAPDYSPTGVPTASPTATAILLERPRCTVDPQGGATCFVVARNQQQSPLENVTVAMRLLDAQAKEVQRQVVATPLDLLLPDAPQPVMAYFSAPLPADFRVAVELISALPATASGNRYLAATVPTPQVKILADGLTAAVSGEAVSQADKAASQVWVAAFGYDADGNVVGVRRWQASGPLPAGGSIPFSLYIYSAAGPIVKVDLYCEARP